MLQPVFSVFFILIWAWFRWKKLWGLVLKHQERQSSFWLNWSTPSLQKDSWRRWFHSLLINNKQRVWDQRFKARSGQALGETGGRCWLEGAELWGPKAKAFHGSVRCGGDGSQQSSHLQLGKEDPVPWMEKLRILMFQNSPGKRDCWSSVHH